MLPLPSQEWTDVMGDLFCHAPPSSLPDTVIPRHCDILVGHDTLLLWATELEPECRVVVRNNKVSVCGLFNN